MAVLGACLCMGFSLGAATRQFSGVAAPGLITVLVSFAAERRPSDARASRVAACALKLQLAGSREQAQELWCMGLVAPWLAGSSQTRN